MCNRHLPVNRARWYRAWLPFCLTAACVSLATAYDIDMLKKRLVAGFGLAPLAPLQRWHETIVESGAIPTITKLEKINGFLNRGIEFADDILVWNQSDYWATPLETLGRGQGDCEDFAIAKYYSLRYAGVPTAKLRLVYVRATLNQAIGPYRPPPGFTGRSFHQAHMVLAYYATPAAEPLVLDNLIMEFKPASQRGDLQPIFSFNGDGIWNGVAGSAPKGPGGLGTLSRWEDLLLRARNEGFD